MWLPAERLGLSGAEQRRLARLVRDPLTPKKLALRASIVIGASKGISNAELARDLAVSRQTVIHWRQKFERTGLGALKPDLPARAQTGSPGGWLPELAGRSPGKREGLLVLVGLFVGARDKALAYSLDDTGARQSPPAAPEAKSQFRRLTRSFFAALGHLMIEDVAGRDDGAPAVFLDFLERVHGAVPQGRAIHLIVDTQGSHNAPAMKSWFDAHRRIHVHCTPRGSSWFRLIKGWFLGEISREQMWPGGPGTLRDLVAAIGAHMQHGEAAPSPFTWMAAE